MKKVPEFIVKYRYVFMGVFIVAAIVFAFFIPKVEANYDMTKYFGNGSATVEALDKMEEEFGISGSAQIMIEDIESSEALNLQSLIAGVDGISSVVFDTSKNYNADKKAALFKVFLKDGNFSPSTHSTINELRELLSDYKVSMSGQSVTSLYLRDAMSTDMTVILIVAVIVIAIILLLSSTSWVDPAIVAIIFGVAILINLGTNYFMGDISFITKSICMILQLALAMDYSIILLHRFNEEKQKENNTKKAMVTALTKTFSPISASSLTTVGGLAALLFMQYKIGLDIGLVLIKGVVISLLTVFLLMPAILILFSKLLEKTKHKSLYALIKQKINTSRENKHKLGKKIFTFSDFQMKTRFIIPIVIVAVIIAGLILQLNVDYSYAVSASKDKNAAVNIEAKNIEQIFGIQNDLIVLLPQGDREKEKAVIAYISDYKIDGNGVVNSAQGSATTGLFTNMTAAQIVMLPQITELGTVDQILISSVISMMTGNPADAVYLYDLLKFVATNETIEAVYPDQYAQMKTIYDATRQSLSALDSKNYTRLIFNMNLSVSSDEAFDIIKRIRNDLSNFYDEFYIVSESAVYLDMKDAFSQDNTLISILSFIAIFIVILISFKSISIPVLLTLLIQGAIWVTMGINFISGSPLYFLCYLIVVCIQMGATVDYAILFTDRYFEARKTMDKKKSIEQSFDASIVTILTSGSILVISAFIVGLVSKISVISELGLLLAQGCLISIIFIIFALPQILLLCDKLILKTTLQSKTAKKPKQIKQ